MELSRARPVDIEVQRHISRLRLFLLMLFAACWMGLSAAHAAPSPEVRRACVADARRLCSAVLFNQRARRLRMRKNRAKLSSGCRAAADRWRVRVRANCIARYSGPRVRGCVMKGLGFPRGS